MKLTFSSVTVKIFIITTVVSTITSTNFSFDAIDGGWSPWSKLVTACHLNGNENILVDCGGGIRKRYRSCTHPVPQGKGRSCEEREDWERKDRAAIDDEYPCNIHPCQLPGVLLWSEWSDCSNSCKKGVTKRYTMCGKIRKRTKRTSTLSDASFSLDTPPITQTLGSLISSTTSFDTTATDEVNTSQITNDVEDSNTSTAITNGSVTTQSRSTAPSTTKVLTTVVEMNTNNPHRIEEVGVGYELQYKEPCKRNQYREEFKECLTWNKMNCNSPCKYAKCPKFAICHDTSNETHPTFECKCQLGTEMKDDSLACIAPQLRDPTPRPHPSMSPAQKTAVVILTRGASTILIIFLLSTLVIFAVARIFDSSRVIHMNMEIALLFAHFFLLPSFHDKSEDACIMISIFVHFFFTACFVFMLLESIHMYSMVAWVVRSDGLLSPFQNTVLGWATALAIVLYNMCFGYEYYGGSYHCWLRMNTPLIYGQYIPIVFITIVTFAIIEAAGDVDGYTKLDNIKEEQRTTAKVIQRTLLLILPMVFTSFILGTLAEFEQNIYLYSVFTLVNGILGAIIFSFHTSANAIVRAKVKGFFCKSNKSEAK